MNVYFPHYLDQNCGLTTVYTYHLHNVDFCYLSIQTETLITIVHTYIYNEWAM